MDIRIREFLKRFSITGFAPKMLLSSPEKEIKHIDPCSRSIKVVGVGGFGCNAVSAMALKGLKNVELIAINTNAQALKLSPATYKLLIGRKMFKKHSVNGDVEMGRKAAQKDSERIRAILNGSDIVFVVVGMGGGTGTGAAPVIMSIAKEIGALTVGIVTMPFAFEGVKRTQNANHGLLNLHKEVATIIISNQTLLQQADKKIMFSDAFALIEGILYDLVNGFSRMCAKSALESVNFRDMQQIMSVKGLANVGIGVGIGENRAIDAVNKATNSWTFKNSSIKTAKGILANITVGQSMSSYEIDKCSKFLDASTAGQTKIVFNVNVNESLGRRMEVTIIATGVTQNYPIL